MTRSGPTPSDPMPPLSPELARSGRPLGRAITLAEIRRQEVSLPRFIMAIFTAFGVIGLGLGAAGLYSVLSFPATRRTHELGVRMALGAALRDVLSLMLMICGYVPARRAARVDPMLALRQD